MEYVLTTNDLRKKYGKFNALDGLTMCVPKGAIYGFVGKNGAGKTTLMRLVCGIQEPTGGGYSLYGIDNCRKEIAGARRRVGAVVEAPAIYLDMTAEDNLRVQRRILGLPTGEGTGDILRLVGLMDTGKKKVKNFSLGMRQRLGIAVALMGNPDFLILDEPVNGLDPQGIIEIRELILTLNREYGITVLISSHILDELSKLATHFGFIDRGCIVKEISAADLESICCKCIHVTVSDTKALSRVLDEEGMEYTIFSDSEADIFGEIGVTDLAVRLAEQNCNIVNMQERGESLENYYMNLVGGEKNI